MCEEQSDEAPERSEERERPETSAKREFSDRGSERQRTITLTQEFDGFYILVILFFFLRIPLKGYSILLFFISSKSFIQAVILFILGL